MRCKLRFRCLGKLGGSIDALEYWRDMLVKLGEVHENKYFLKHLIPGSEEKSHFWQTLWLGECLKNNYIIGSRDDSGNPWPMTA